MQKGSAIIICLLLTILATDVLCRGGRGGGGRGGSRGGYRGGSSRSSSRGGSRYGRTSSGRYTSYAGAFAAGYTIAGLTRYRTRYYGTRYYSEDPPVCFNSQRYLSYDNGTVSRTIKLNYFVCPYEDSDDPSATYCCGDEGKQKCCTYWDSPGRMAGAIIGIIIGAVVVIIVLVCCVKCFCADCCKSKSTSNVTLGYHAQPNQKQNSVSAYQHPTTQHEKSAYPDAVNGQAYTTPGQPPYYPPQPGTGSNYPAQPMAGGIGFEGAGGEPAPPSYNDVISPNKP